VSALVAYEIPGSKILEFTSPKKLLAQVLKPQSGPGIKGPPKSGPLMRVDRFLDQ